MNSRHSEWLDSIPPDWNCITLDQLGKVISGSTPSRATPKYWDGEHPWVTPGELSNLKTSHLLETRDHLTRTGLLACSSGLLPREALLITTRATIGAKALAGVPVSTNQGFKSIVFSSGENPNFYFHVFDLMPGELKRLASGTTFLEISGHEFKRIRIPSPCPLEQRRIAEILDTVDEAIRRTEQVIEKLQQMKQGLLHDLLTRGIGDNGELRPPPEEAPHLYKDSPLGLIPKGWTASLLGSLVNLYGGFGFPESFQGIKSGELPFFKVSDMSVRGNERHLTIANNYVPQKLAVRQGWHPAPAQGVAFAKVGAALLLNRRRVLSSDSLVDNNMMVAVAGARMNATWLYWWLQTIDFAMFVQPGALPSVNQGQLASLPLRLPSLPEQENIQKILDDLDHLICAEVSERDEKRSIKIGLRDDLLTGRVRVNVPEGEC